MDEVTHHCSEAYEANEPSDDEKNDKEVDNAIHDLGVFQIICQASCRDEITHRK